MARVQQDRYGCPVKVRACDDGRMCGISRAVGVRTLIQVDTEDVYAEVLRRFVEAAGHGPFVSIAWNREAYRLVGAASDEVLRVVVAREPT